MKREKGKANEGMSLSLCCSHWDMIPPLRLRSAHGREREAIAHRFLLDGLLCPAWQSPSYMNPWLSGTSRLYLQSWMPALLYQGKHLGCNVLRREIGRKYTWTDMDCPQQLRNKSQDRATFTRNICYAFLIVLGCNYALGTASGWVLKTIGKCHRPSFTKRAESVSPRAQLPDFSTVIIEIIEPLKIQTQRILWVDQLAPYQSYSKVYYILGHNVPNYTGFFQKCYKNILLKTITQSFKVDSFRYFFKKTSVYLFFENLKLIYNGLWSYHPPPPTSHKLTPSQTSHPIFPSTRALAQTRQAFQY